MKKAIYIPGIIIIIFGALYAYYMFNKPHINVQKQDADFEISGDAILNDFLSDPSAANIKYSGKIILVDGTLNSEISENTAVKSILISSEEAIINCELDSTQMTDIHKFTKGDQIYVKGIFVGYDDLLGELQINNCYIVED